MSVLIKGMEMPSECEYCPLCRYYTNSRNVWCNALNVLLKKQWDNADYTHLDIQRREDCPLVEVPTPHGRLIDVNDLLDDICLEDNDYNRDVNEGEIITLENVDRIPTVIEAEE